MSEFDKLKDDAEQYAQQHPEQVKKGERAVEDKLGIGQQGESQQDQSGQDPQGGKDDDQDSAVKDNDPLSMPSGQFPGRSRGR
jgi:hypothetical protein